MSEKEKEKLILSLIDSTQDLDVFYSNCLEYARLEFNHDAMAFVEIDPAEMYFKVKEYSKPEIKKTYLSKLIVSLDDEKHPYNLCFRLNYPLFVDSEEINKESKFFDMYSKISGKKYFCLIPLTHNKKKLGIISFDFSTQEERNTFRFNQTKIQKFTEFISTIAHNIYIYNRSDTKYSKYKTLHSSGLTLNRLYLNNTQEILKMTLLSISGLIEANLYILLMNVPNINTVTVNRLFKDIDELDLSQIHFDSVRYTDIDTFMTLNSPRVFSLKEVSFAKEIGFRGRQLLALPTFELQGSKYTFLVGRYSRKSFSQDELEILTAYSEIVKITIENSFMYHRMAKQERLEKEVEIARDIQMNLLPRETPQIPNFEFGGFMIPAREIGGDYYDFLHSPEKDGVIMAIGDVSGKGIPAGIVMATARTIIHSIVRKTISIQEIIKELNSYLYFNYRNSMILRFMSMIILQLDNHSNTLHYVGAGHGYILIYRKKTDSVETVLSGGMVLGIAPDVPESNGKIHLDEGDAVLLYTDGVTEYTNMKGEPYEEERLHESFVRHNQKDVNEMLIAIYDDVKKFGGNALQFDDITLVAMKKLK
ncbi:MAG: PP2C family protein-serine/threonine phosphatase [Leptospiraceae bacterium]|nr:PP2C family protein-serine/threonine phosphatase [Leptospiraceae bacterium]MCP5512292.1 PP2C family protein-serine/threonine phosphatase [Leptospiraceae bacterium]